MKVVGGGRSYLESLYALLSIGGMYLLMSGVNNVLALLFALSGSARLNGVLNGGYYDFKALHQSYYAMYVKQRANILLAGALWCICISIPLLAFQAFGYCNICHGRNPDEMRPWCKAKIPFVIWFYPKSLLGCWPFAVCVG